MKSPTDGRHTDQFCNQYRITNRTRYPSLPGIPFYGSLFCAIFLEEKRCDLSKGHPGERNPCLNLEPDPKYPSLWPKRFFRYIQLLVVLARYFLSKPLPGFCRRPRNRRTKHGPSKQQERETPRTQQKVQRATRKRILEMVVAWIVNSYFSTNLPAKQSILKQ